MNPLTGNALRPFSGASLNLLTGNALIPLSGAALNYLTGNALKPLNGAALSPLTGNALRPSLVFPIYGVTVGAAAVPDVVDSDSEVVLGMTEDVAAVAENNKQIIITFEYA